MVASGNRVLELDGITKSFGGVRAVDGASFHVDGGEVVCLLGDNGAGKSTLVKIITGVHTPDSGQMSINGELIKRWNPARARDAGVQTVFQDRSLAGRQTVARNIFMGRELTTRFGLIDDKRQEAEAEALLRGVGFTSKALSARSEVLNLSGGERQGIAIARAMHFAARLLILDEPTESMSLTQIRLTLGFTRAARDRGIAVLLISHNIADAYAVGDRFLVLDRGRVLETFHKSEISEGELVRFMEHANADSAGTGSRTTSERQTTQESSA
ncbi:MAG: simple sugar transport system ATP-binding protein [Thermoanaerobaculia bacterium]|jgi:simple sugar transport system ATP-binding protein|nr:simple sugar transport system ATP-binding protein [Actinomycetota bacterium]MEA2346137.1 simple sugar transport system ATP-binding protein [Thermoanaerobaculia bacterium]